MLLNVEAIKARGLSLVGILLNTLDDNQDEHMDNAADLRERLNCALYIQKYNAGSIADGLVTAIAAQSADAAG